jgi:hypothetical protein
MHLRQHLKAAAFGAKLTVLNHAVHESSVDSYSWQEWLRKTRLIGFCYLGQDLENFRVAVDPGLTSLITQ